MFKSSLSNTERNTCPHKNKKQKPESQTKLIPSFQPCSPDFLLYLEQNLFQGSLIMPLPKPLCHSLQADKLPAAVLLQLPDHFLPHVPVAVSTYL